MPGSQHCGADQHAHGTQSPALPSPSSSPDVEPAEAHAALPPVDVSKDGNSCAAESPPGDSPAATVPASSGCVEAARLRHSAPESSVVSWEAAHDENNADVDDTQAPEQDAGAPAAAVHTPRASTDPSEPTPSQTPDRKGRRVRQNDSAREAEPEGETAVADNHLVGDTQECWPAQHQQEDKRLATACALFRSCYIVPVVAFEACRLALDLRIWPDDIVHVQLGHKMGTPAHACRHASASQQHDSATQGQLLDERAEEVSRLKAQVRRLERSRAWGDSVAAESGDLVSMPRGELGALRRDLAVCFHAAHYSWTCALHLHA
jgi:hypothetical protein